MAVVEVVSLSITSFPAERILPAGGRSMPSVVPAPTAARCPPPPPRCRRRCLVGRYHPWNRHQQLRPLRLQWTLASASEYFYSILPSGVLCWISWNISLLIVFPKERTAVPLCLLQHTHTPVRAQIHLASGEISLGKAIC